MISMVLLIMQEWIDGVHVDLVLVEMDLMNKWNQHGKFVEQMIFYKHGIIDNARVNWWSICGLSACWSGLDELMKSTWQIRWANDIL
jgi:hypothetical protein